MAPPPADDHQSFWLEVPTVTWAMHLIAHAAARIRGSALDYIDEALARMERYHNQRVATVLAVLRALALDVRGEREAALDSLAATVRVAKPRGLVRSFVDCGPRVKELLDELMTRSDPDPYIQSLRAAFGSTKHDPAALRPSEVLTYRELETLELLAWRMTNKEIAAKLSVSPAAIKKRLESIYAKLDARDRRAAVAAAVSKGLISPPVR
jgi:LuxR family maltose regulon positive regulatory protein